MQPRRRAMAAAAAVHAFTALGSVCALLATLAVFEREWERCFAWLGVAFVIDGVDGWFARRAKVAERLPRFSGEVLDLVVDYVTYVFVPVLALRQAGLLPGAFGLLLASGILLSSLFHFADMASKDREYHFIGFPAIWNVVAFYLLAFPTGPQLAAIVVAGGVLLTFVPWPWVHPLRVTELRRWTIAATVAWGCAAIAAVAGGFPVDTLTGSILLAVAAYGVALSLLWRLRSRS